MAGTKAGGQKAAATNRAKHGTDFYAKIGAKGGAAGTTGGFAAHVPCNCDLIEGLHEKQRCSGKKGGLKSRIPKKAV